jgi:hypothetical protein
MDNMSRASAVSAFLLLLVLSGCDAAAVQGSGNVITEPRSVSGFQAVTLNGNGEVLIDQTGRELLTITADDNLMPQLTSEVRGNQLVLAVKGSVNPTTPVVYKLEVGKLSEITVSGSNKVVAKGIVGDTLRIQGSGSTGVTISGQAGLQEVTLSGSGEYQAEDLQSKQARITITGSGKAVVSASDRLDVTITGSGSVEYIGDPELTKSVTGAGSIEKRQPRQ